MRVKVNVYAYLRLYAPAAKELFHDKEWDVSPDAKVSDLLEKLNLPEEVRVTVLLNNNSVDPTALLKEGDIVHILPQMAGG